MVHKKPKGKIGPINISIDASTQAPKLTFQSLMLPDTKEEIEDEFVKKFIISMKKTGALILNCIKNVENDFDYTLTLPKGDVYLELSEIILRNGNKSPYDNANISVDLKEIADAILESIRKKAERYKGIIGKPLHLLLYVTHWRFTISETILSYVHHQLLSMQHAFEDIFLYEPLDQENGILTVFSNGNVAMLSPSYKLYKTDSFAAPDGTVLILDPNKWELCVG